MSLPKSKIYWTQISFFCDRRSFLAVAGFSVKFLAKGETDSAPCSPRRRELRVRGIRSIFKVTAIFDSYSPRPRFWHHLFHDPPASTHIHTHSCFTTHITHGHTHTHERKREVESIGARLRSMSNCTMPADTPPISEHQLCSTPSLCSTLVARSRTILKSNDTPQRPRFRGCQIYAINSVLPACIFLNKTTPVHEGESP